MLVWKIFFLIYTSGILLTCFYIFSLERIIILVSCVHIKTKQFNFDFSQSAWAFQLVKSQFCCHNSLRQQDFPDNIQLFWWIFPILKISSSSIQLKIGDRKNQALFLKWTTERYNNDLNENKKFLCLILLINFYFSNFKQLLYPFSNYYWLIPWKFFLKWVPWRWLQVAQSYFLVNKFKI